MAMNTCVAARYEQFSRRTRGPLQNVLPLVLAPFVAGGPVPTFFVAVFLALDYAVLA